MQLKTSIEYRTKTPWHLWLIGFLFIFIYANGVYDYFMMLGHDANYYNSKNYGENVVEYFTDYPFVFLVFYTINIFGGLIAPILLLFRTRWAAFMALVSAVSMLFLEVLTFAFRDRWNVLGAWVSLFDIALLLLTGGFYFYCRTLAKRDVLK
jgi:hypothetical protein